MEDGGLWVSKPCGLDGRVYQKPQEPIKPRKEADEGRLVTSVENHSGLVGVAEKEPMTVESLCKADGKDCM